MTQPSQKSFALCPICGATTDEAPGGVKSRLDKTENYLFRWTECKVCGTVSRQKYSAYLHKFFDAEPMWPSIR